MEQKRFEKILNKIYSGLTIIEYTVLPRYQLNENNEWRSDSPALFVSIIYESDDNNDIRSGRLSQRLSDMTGCEVNIDEGLSKKKYSNKIRVDGEET